MSDNYTVEVRESPEKQWTKEFDKKNLFEQVTVLHNLHQHVVGVELKLQIVKLLTERILQYSEYLQKSEVFLEQQLGIAQRVSLISQNKDQKGL